MLDSLTIYRVIKAGFVNFWRNFWLSAAATMVMTVTLLIFGLLALVFGITNLSLKNITDRVDVSVYFQTGTAEQTINQFEQELHKNAQIADVSYTSAAQALEDFKASYAGDQLVLESLAELTDNPLPAAVHIKAHNIADYPELVSNIQNGPFKDKISKVNFEDNRLLIERFGKISHAVIYGGLGLVIVFSIIAILVIFNTITLTIYNRREEVEIMRLVGATNWYIRGPFILEALLYSVAATMIAGGIISSIVTQLKNSLLVSLGLQGSLLAGNSYMALKFLLPGLLALAVLLSVTSSMLAIRKYLKT